MRMQRAETLDLLVSLFFIEPIDVAQLLRGRFPLIGRFGLWRVAARRFPKLIRSALYRIAQDGVRSRDFLENLRVFRLVRVSIGMIPLRQLSVGVLDGFGGCRGLNAQHLVEALPAHA